MLEGFNYPLTPKGKSTLNPLPPWYYSADFLDVEFWSDPGAVAALLPEGFDRDAQQMVAATLSSTTGSSVAITRSTSTLRVTNTASFYTRGRALRG
jgi:hypothetical protein